MYLTDYGLWYSVRPYRYNELSSNSMDKKTICEGSLASAISKFKNIKKFGVQVIYNGFEFEKLVCQLVGEGAELILSPRQLMMIDDLTILAMIDDLGRHEKRNAPYGQYFVFKVKL